MTTNCVRAVGKPATTADVFSSERAKLRWPGIKEGMPLLTFSERAWLATTEPQRMHLKELFDALLRNHLQIGDHLPGTLQLDLPGEGDPHYRFIAEKHGNVWWVDAKVKRPDQKIRFRNTSRL